MVPANVYATRDGGWIAVSGAGDQPFARLCEAIEAPEAPKDPRFATPAARLQHRAAADALVGDLDRPPRPGRRRGALRRGRGGRHRGPLGRRHPRRRARAGARGPPVALVVDRGRRSSRPRPVPKLTRTPAADPPRRPAARRAHGRRARSDRRLAARPRVDALAPPGAGAGGGPLAGVRVLDLSQWLAGPAAAAPSSATSAPTSSWSSCRAAAGPPTPGPARAPAVRVTNRNKRSITLDVRAPRGREVFLGARARERRDRRELPSRHARALGPRARPRSSRSTRGSCCCAHPASARAGPYTARAAFNPVGLAFGGITYLNGWPDRPPLRDGVMAGDYSTALFNVLGHAGRAAAPRRRRAGAGGRHRDVRGRRCA